MGPSGNNYLQTHTVRSCESNRTLPLQRPVGGLVSVHSDRGALQPVRDLPDRIYPMGSHAQESNRGPEHFQGPHFCTQYHADHHGGWRALWDAHAGSALYDTSSAASLGASRLRNISLVYLTFSCMLCGACGSTTPEPSNEPPPEESDENATSEDIRWVAGTPEFILGEGYCRLRFEVSRTVVPAEEWPGRDDKRSFAIYFFWLEIFPES